MKHDFRKLVSNSYFLAAKILFKVFMKKGVVFTTAEFLGGGYFQDIKKRFCGGRSIVVKLSTLINGCSERLEII